VAVVAIDPERAAEVRVSLEAADADADADMRVI